MCAPYSSPATELLVIDIIVGREFWASGLTSVCLAPAASQNFSLLAEFYASG